MNNNNNQFLFFFFSIYFFSYPPREAKTSLAKAIVTEFPFLKSVRAGPNGYVC